MLLLPRAPHASDPHLRCSGWSSISKYTDLLLFLCRSHGFSIWASHKFFHDNPRHTRTIWSHLQTCTHPYMTTEKIIAWIIWTFVSKVMSLLFIYIIKLFHLHIWYTRYLISKLWKCVRHSVMSNNLWPHALAAHQAPLFMEFSRQECWSGEPFPPPVDLPDPRIELGSLYQLNHHW